MRRILRKNLLLVLFAKKPKTSSSSPHHRPVSIRTAILETGYPAERKRIADLLKAKAIELSQIDTENYFHSAAYHPHYTPLRIAELIRDVETINGFLLHTDAMTEAHEQQLEATADAYDQDLPKIIKIYKRELEQADHALAFEKEMHLGTIESCNFLLSRVIDN